MNHVWAFKYANLGENPIEEGHEKHLIASSLVEATERANQFLIDDGLKHASYTEHGYDFQITTVRRIATLDWPTDGEYSVVRHDADCAYCCDQTCSLAGDPGEWPLWFCHPAEPGVARAHHTRCVQERLFGATYPTPAEPR